MAGRTRRAAAVGAATFVLAGTAALTTTTTGTAVAAPPLIAGSCGATLSGEPGQPIALNVGSLLGNPKAPTITIGTVQPGTNTIAVPGSQILGALSGLLKPILGPLVPNVCKVTVKAVNNVAAPVQDGAQAVAETGRDVVEGAARALNPGRKPAPQNPGGNGPGPQNPGPQPGTGGPGGEGSAPGAQRPAPGPGLLPPNSPVLGGGSGLPGFAALPTSFGGGFAPMRDYSNLPAASAGLFAPSPGLRYGGQVPGYAPQFGILGKDQAGRASGDESVQNAGRAEALPGSGGNPMTDAVGLPVLIAVLALSGVTAALVRTWVLRRSVEQGV
ncbi:hypothetical protein CFN78_14000 [Amycolatopsis antarctica]|uniref:Uncharacterized protein n=1 Tax=Amycolatopsis antarctica TaxID=1854586 RepID=A0A263D2Q1_9PSEU|nr:hypothetical protein [Amycolatopsis antarctica]OZM72730.1 hypothetical protein CFN78_14000 [Amycolatopsis antarctica]